VAQAVVLRAAMLAARRRRVRVLDHTGTRSSPWSGGDVPVHGTGGGRVRTGARVVPSGWAIGRGPLRRARRAGEDRGMTCGVVLVGRIHLDLGRLQSVALCR
jgi:hypothetical protein